jgi:hypothetical protein
LGVFVEEAVDIDNWQERVDVVEVASEELLSNMVVGKRYRRLLSIVPEMVPLVNLFIDNVMRAFQGTIRCTDVEDELEALRLSWRCSLVPADTTFQPVLFRSFLGTQLAQAVTPMVLSKAHWHLPILELLPLPGRGIEKSLTGVKRDNIVSLAFDLRWPCLPPVKDRSRRGLPAQGSITANIGR